MLLYLTGCNDGYLYLNATSNGDCTIQCNRLTNSQEYHCLQATATYSITSLNEEIKNKSCECILMDCFNKVNGDDKKW